MNCRTPREKTPQRPLLRSQYYLPPDNNPSMMPAPTAPAPKPPLAWFQEGYEPEWDGRPVSSSSIYYTSEAQHDEYGDPYADIGSTAASTLLSEQYLLRYDILSPVTVLERGHAQWEWEQVVTAAFPNQYWNSSASYYVGGAFSAQVSEIYTLNHDADSTNNKTIPDPVGLHTLVYTATTPYVRFVPPPPPVSGSVGANTNTGSGVTAQTTNPDEPDGGTGWGTPEETPPPPPPAAPAVPVSPASNKIDGGAEEAQPNNGDTQGRMAATSEATTDETDIRNFADAVTTEKSTDSTANRVLSEEEQQKRVKVVVVTINRKTGDRTERILTAEEFEKEAIAALEKELASAEEQRKTSHAKWLSTIPGSDETQFQKRVRHFRSNPASKEDMPGDALVKAYITYRTQEEMLEMQVAAASGTSYKSTWLAQSRELLADGPLDSLDGLLETFEKLYREEGMRLLNLVMERDWSIRVTESTGRASLRNKNIEIPTMKLSDSPTRGGRLVSHRTNRSGAAELYKLLLEVTQPSQETLHKWAKVAKNKGAYAIKTGNIFNGAVYRYVREDGTQVIILSQSGTPSDQTYRILSVLPPKIGVNLKEILNDLDAGEKLESFAASPVAGTLFNTLEGNWGRAIIGLVGDLLIIAPAVRGAMTPVPLPRIIGPAAATEGVEAFLGGLAEKHILPREFETAMWIADDILGQGKNVVAVVLDTESGIFVAGRRGIAAEELLEPLSSRYQWMARHYDQAATAATYPGYGWPMDPILHEEVDAINQLIRLRMADGFQIDLSRLTLAVRWKRSGFFASRCGKCQWLTDGVKCLTDRVVFVIKFQ